MVDVGESAGPGLPIGPVSVPRAQIGTPPPAVGAAAQPTMSPTEPGAPPLASTVPPVTASASPAGSRSVGAQPAAAAAQAPPTGGTPPPPYTALPPSTTQTRTAAPPSRRVQRPREIFQSPEQAMFGQRRAQAQGDVEGEVAGLVAAGASPEEARAAILEKYQRLARGGAADRSIFGEILQPDGTWQSGSVVFDPQSGQHFDSQTGERARGFRRSTTTGSTSLGTWAERAAGELGYASAAAARAEGPEAMQRVNARAQELEVGRAAAIVSSRGDALAQVPLNTQQRFQATQDLAAIWTKATAQPQELRRQYGLMQNGLARYTADPIGASQAVLVTFQKMLDPTSVVRESEYARSTQGLSLVNWLRGKYAQYIGLVDADTGQWVSGGVGVPQEVLAEIAKTAETFYTDENMQSGLENVRQRLLTTATNPLYAIPPEQIFGPNPLAGITDTPDTTSTTTPAAPGTAPRFFQDASGNWIIER
jgi:hypothetical protein